MKKTMAQIIAAAMATHACIPQGAFAGEIAGETACVKKINQLSLPAVCGYKVDPKYPKLGEVKFRTFTEPSTNLVVKEYLIGRDDKNRPIVHVEKFQKKVVTTTQITTETKTTKRPVVERIKAPAARTAPVEVKSTAGRDWLIIGGAVVAVVGGALWARHHYKSKYETREQNRLREERRFQEGVAAGREQANSHLASLKQMPEKITLGQNAPKGMAGQTVQPVGAVPSREVPANVPRYQTAGGDTYIIQQNPNTGFLETILIYDLLTRPLFWGPFHYHSFAYSPYIIDPVGHMVMNESLAHGSRDLAFSTQDVSVARETRVVEEVTSTETQMSQVSDSMEVQSDFFGEKGSSQEMRAVDMTDSNPDYKMVDDRVVTEQSNDSYMSSDSSPSSSEGISILDSNRNESFSDSSSNSGSSGSDFFNSSSSSDYSSSSSSDYSSSSFDSGSSSSSDSGSSF